jgi:hypothetical protein
MIRGDTTPGAPDAFMLETGPNFGHNEPVFQWRTNAGGFTSDSDNHIFGLQAAPVWLRLVRSGNTFTGYWAQDVNGGQSHGPWQNLGGPQTVNLGSNVLVGLGLTAHNNGTLASAVFDHVTVTQNAPTALGAPTGLTVAHVAPYRSRSSITISWHPGSDNEAGFKVERSSDGANFTQVGTAPAGATTFTDTNPDNQGVPDGTYYYRVKAFATGLADSAYSNVDSVKFVQPGSTLTIDHSAGFASHADLTTSGSASIFPNPAPVGTFLGHQDLGAVAAPGGATFDGVGAYAVQASGSDIWDVTDSFQFVYKPLTGDGEIDVRAVNVGPTDFWAKAGVMFRESLRANSRNAFMLETPNLDGFFHNEPVFQWRTDPGGFTADSGNHIMTEPPAPIWLRLVRQGNNFTGYWALDVNGGQGHGPWNQLGPTVTINMASTVYVGLAVTAHNNDGRINTSTFDHLTITGATGPLPPSVAEVTDGGFGEAGGLFLNNRVGVQNFSTTFTFQITPGTTPTADGMAFVIQGVGPTALGPVGGGLGYGSDTLGGGGGLPRSLAIKFDLFDNAGEGVNSTGIFTGGRSPTVRQPGLAPGFPDTSIDLTGTGIDLHSGHPFTVTLTYDGTTLTETITDTVTSATFTTTYEVNIPGLVGSDVGYVGFTGGTGGLTAIQDILSWTIQTTLAGRGAPSQPQLAAAGPAPAGGAAALTPAELAPVARAAVARWAAAGLSAAQLAKLNAVQFYIGALGGGALGLTRLGATVVWLDATAAGYGWFVDLTPAGDSEFAVVVATQELLARPGSPAFGRMDLLTVVEHELGHVLGLGDLDPQAVPHDLLTETLATGVRRFPRRSARAVVPTAVEVAPPAPTSLAVQAPADQLTETRSAPLGLGPALWNGPWLVGANGAAVGAARLDQLIGSSGPAWGLPDPLATVGLVGGPPTPLSASGGAGDGPARPPLRTDPGGDVGALDQVFSSPELWDVFPGGRS